MEGPIVNKLPLLPEFKPECDELESPCMDLRHKKRPTTERVADTYTSAIHSVPHSQYLPIILCHSPKTLHG